MTEAELRYAYGLRTGQQDRLAALLDASMWDSSRSFYMPVEVIAARLIAGSGIGGPGPMTEAELRYAYGLRTGEALREAAARVARWTYVPSSPSKMLDLARDIAELREALADEIAADQLEAFPDALPVADDELDVEPSRSRYDRDADA